MVEGILELGVVLACGVIMLSIASLFAMLAIFIGREMWRDFNGPRRGY